MKKLTFMAALVIAAVAFTACGNSTPKANLKTEIDTLSYAIGMSQTQGLKEYLTQQGIDTTYMDAFIKGLNEGANAGDDKKKSAYYTGMQIGQQIANVWVKGINHQVFGEDSTQTISLKNLMAGFISGTTGKKGLMNMEQANIIREAKMQQIMRKSLEKQFGANKIAGEKFLKENAKKEGVKTLDGGVQYKVLKEGSGEIPSDTSKVIVNYEGRTIDGKVFESSYKTGQPLHIQVNRVIKGWTTALTRMPVGSTWEVYIPQDLAYGDRETSNFKPFSALIFKIELVGIEK